MREFSVRDKKIQFMIDEEELKRENDACNKYNNEQLILWHTKIEEYEQNDKKRRKIDTISFFITSPILLITAVLILANALNQVSSGKTAIGLVQIIAIIIYIVVMVIQLGIKKISNKKFGCNAKPEMFNVKNCVRYTLYKMLDAGQVLDIIKSDDNTIAVWFKNGPSDITYKNINVKIEHKDKDKENNIDIIVDNDITYYI